MTLADIFDIRADAWMADAECRGMNTRLFFSGSRIAIAKTHAACARCPVRAECAAAGEGEFGIWGGREVNAAGTPQKPIEHGKERGYYQHRRRGESPCDACRNAGTAAMANRRRAERIEGDHDAPGHLLVVEIDQALHERTPK